MYKRQAKHFLAQFPELVILKAFTKLYAMAGVRLGYVLSGDEKLLENMREAGQPWAVSSLAQAAGVAALDETEYADHVRSLIARAVSYTHLAVSARRLPGALRKGTQRKYRDAFAHQNRNQKQFTDCGRMRRLFVFRSNT